MSVVFRMPVVYLEKLIRIVDRSQTGPQVTGRGEQSIKPFLERSHISCSVHSVKMFTVHVNDNERSVWCAAASSADTCPV
jgi:hypothetical protein